MGQFNPVAIPKVPALSLNYFSYSIRYFINQEGGSAFAVLSNVVVYKANVCCRCKRTLAKPTMVGATLVSPIPSAICIGRLLV